MVDEALEEKWRVLLEVREDVYRGIEDARKEGLLGTSLEAQVVIYASGDKLSALERVREQLPALLIVSAVEVRDLSAFGGERTLEGDTEIVIERAPGEKCQRCWNYSLRVGEREDRPDICERCVSALEAIGR
jgi:isoleucyl-tRNA synthetase